MSSSLQLKPDWKRHWKIARPAPVTASNQKTRARRLVGSASAPIIRGNPPKQNFAKLPADLAKVLTDFCQNDKPTDRRYRIALACYEYLSDFYELNAAGEVADGVVSEVIWQRSAKKLKPDLLQNVFEQVVGRAEREEELGLRQRANYLKLLEELREKLQPCFPGMRLEAPHNYSRSLRHLPVSPEVNLAVPPHYRERVLAVLEAAVLASPELVVDPADGKAGIKSAEAWQKAHSERFARFALLLMLKLGVTFRGVIGAVCRMELQDVHLEAGYVVLYHRANRRTWLPVWLDDLSAIALSSLIIHASRRRENVRKRTIQSQQDHTLLSNWQVLPTAPTPDGKDETEEDEGMEEGDSYSFEEMEEEEEATDDVTLNQRGSKSLSNQVNRAEVELRRQKRQLDDSFKAVCQQAGLESPVTLVQMLHSTRWSLNEQAAFGPTKTGAVVALLSGFIKSSFFPEEMVQLDWSVNLPEWFAKLVETEKQAGNKGAAATTTPVKQSYPKRVGQSDKRRHSENTAGLEASWQLKLSREIEQANQELREALRGLDDHHYTGSNQSLTRRQEDRRQRAEAGLALRQLVAKWLGIAETSSQNSKPGATSHRMLAERLRYYHANALEADRPIIPVYRLNLITLALWLASELEEAKTPKRSETISSYRSEGIYLLKTLPEKLFSAYDGEDAEEVLELDLAEEPPIRRKAVLKDLRAYLLHCGIILSPLDLESDRFKNTARTTRGQILVPNQLWKIADGLKPVKPGKDRSLLLALLLGYFLMLRDGEICRLEWADFELESPQPFVRIVNTKRHKSRNVPLENIPVKIIELLKCWKEQAREEGSSAWLILSEKQQPLSPSRLSALVKEQLRKGGYEEVSLHDLRKSGANWRYYSSLNQPATLVGRQLGHSGLMVTFKCYLKGLDLVQREAALQLMPSVISAASEVEPAEEWTLPVAKLAKLANLSSRQQAYNLVGGRKLTLKLVRSILTEQL